MNWTQLSPEDTAKFLNAVSDKNEPAIFDPALCEVHSLPLSFYDGYTLTRIINKHMLPFVILDYLSNGENHYYLDGSENAFHNLNARQAISLSEHNALNYLSLYISYVYERGNSFEFFQVPQEGFETKLLKAENGHYQITAPLFYQNKTVQSLIDITENGAIHVRAPINVSFLETLTPNEITAYRHPYETKIIEACKEILGTTQTGAALLKAGEKTEAKIRVFNSPNYHGFITNECLIYIMMPKAEQNAKYLQAVLMAGYLYNAEQMREGYFYPPPSEDKDLYVAVNYGKNLDMFDKMCRMVKELEDQNISEGVHALQQLNLKELYEGFKQGLSREALLDIYVQALTRQGLIEQ